MDRDAEEAGRLLDRLAGQVPVATAPLDEVLATARRARRRRRFVAAVVAFILVGGGAAVHAELDGETHCAVANTECADFP